MGITEITLNNGKKMPILGVGTADFPLPPPEVVVKAVLEAIQVGYRMFDTAALYGTEPALGEAISQALDLGLIKSRDELFITSKLYSNDNHADRVLPALQKTLKNLKLEYLDQYLIHWPVSIKPDAVLFPPNPADVVPMDIKGVWTAMEECQTLGLTKSIGVSNFSCKKLADILAFAKIPPAVNQVEMNPAWQQGKLREFCKANGIVLSIYSPLGAAGNMWGTKSVLESKIALRWAYEQGVVIVTKSFNRGRLQENLDIFDWKLTDEDVQKIAAIPQARANEGLGYISETGHIKSVEELWDGEI
ncbi:hypothetical protein DCAR_0833096 [Daucus carota subsp. sativus]|uniref:NADP-dependent oxidoreductase domain-containing protein n=1 Tax=Daucus carota subsp. sativus TaxID=79200 RepID=A0AAF0XSL6_DAUCS|nr:hypothetical protein DCAR_0833096 [Daucus carota subsp. sativus]